jgi:hypothetical protein
MENAKVQELTPPGLWHLKEALAVQVRAFLLRKGSGKYLFRGLSQGKLIVWRRHIMAHAQFSCKFRSIQVG